MTTETKPSLCIVGAGIAGLSAGIYGQLNGFTTHIFEKHALPGGLCTAWQRRGYWFDGCVHYLLGSGPDQWGYGLMSQVGLVGERPFIDLDAWTSVETQSGARVTFYADIDRLEQNLIEVAKQEAAPHGAAGHGAARDDAAHDVAHIRAFTRAARAFTRTPLPDGSPQPLGELLRRMPRLLGALPHLVRWLKVPFEQFIAGFRSPALREAFTRFFGYSELPDIPTMFPMLVVSQFANRNAGVPQGGSLALARDVERRYLELGGQVHYRSPVERILVDGAAAGSRAAAGVRLADGTEHRADVVLSAADARATLYQMLGESYVSPAYQEAFKRRAVVPPFVQVSLGVARTFEGIPHILNWPLGDPVIVAGQAHHRLNFHHFGHDPTLAPEGKTPVVVIYETEYALWKALAGDRAAYEAEKERIAEQVIDRLEARFPGLREQVEVVDVATPLTTERYTGNWQGSPQGWVVTVANMTHNLPCKLDGLERFYMAGQWVRMGGGLPGGVQSAQDTVRQICRDLGRPFVSGS